MKTQCTSSDARQVAPASPPAAPSRWRARTPVIAAALIGLVWSGFASYFVWKWEAGVARQELDSRGGRPLPRAAERAQRISEQADRAAHVLRGLRGHQPRGIRDLMARDCCKAKRRCRTSRGCRWSAAPKEPVMSIWRAGKASAKYEIKALTVDDKIIPSPERTEYLPIYYSTVERGTAHLRCRPVVAADHPQPARAGARQQRVVGGPGILSAHAGTGPSMAFCSRCQSIAATWRSTRLSSGGRILSDSFHGAFQTAEAIDFILKTGTTARGLDIYLYLADAAPDAAPLHVQSSACGRRPQSPSRGRSCKARRTCPVSCKPAMRAGPWLPCRHRTAQSRPGTIGPGLCCLPACFPALPPCSICARPCGTRSV